MMLEREREREQERYKHGRKIKAVAQLAERLLPIPEVHGLDLVIGKIF